MRFLLRYIAVLSFFIFGSSPILRAQGDSIYALGRYLFNHCGDTLILRGANYSVLDDWDFPANMNNGNERSYQISRTGANAVRIMWYNDYGQPSRPPYSLTDLDSVITRCARFGMIPVVGLWDMTCSNNWSLFPTRITDWWNQSAVRALINKHKRYLIINLANEMGYYQWTGNPGAALVTYKNNYKTAITALRSSGVNVPVMIDAPDCGQNSDALVLAGQELINHDPLHNIILSAHAYWISFTGNDSTAIANKITAIVNSGIPFVFGEAANYQSDTEPCQYLLNYNDVLEICKINRIGWLSWTWFKDYCSDREMTHSGLYDNLTPYGNDLVNNNTFGIRYAQRNEQTFDVCTFLPLEWITCKAAKEADRNFIHIKYKGSNLDSIWLEESDDLKSWDRVYRSKIKRQDGEIVYDAGQPTSIMRYFRAGTSDFSGRKWMSNLASLSPEEGRISVIYSGASIHISGVEEGGHVIISDMYGHIIGMKQIQADPEIISFEENPGIYIVVVEDERRSHRAVYKLFIKR